MRPTTRTWNCSASTGPPLRRAPRWARGYGWQPTIDVAALDETETAFFTLLTKLRTLLTERMPRVAEDEKTYYRAMLYSVEQMIGSRNLK